MNPSTPTLWNTLHQLFDATGTRAGASMHLGDLMNAWSGTGLSMEHLSDALGSLCQAGFVRLQDTPKGPMARLIDAGFGSARGRHPLASGAVLDRAWRRWFAAPAAIPVTAVDRADSTAISRPALTALPALAPGA